VCSSFSKMVSPHKWQSLIHHQHLPSQLQRAKHLCQDVNHPPLLQVMLACLLLSGGLHKPYQVHWFFGAWAFAFGCLLKGLRISTSSLLWAAEVLAAGVIMSAALWTAACLVSAKVNDLAVSYAA